MLPKVNGGVGSAPLTGGTTLPFAEERWGRLNTCDAEFVAEGGKMASHGMYGFCVSFGKFSLRNVGAATWGLGGFCGKPLRSSLGVADSEKLYGSSGGTDQEYSSIPKGW